MGYNTNEANMLQHIHLMLTQINDSVIASAGGGGGGGDVAIISSSPQLNLEGTQLSVLAAVDGIETLTSNTNTLLTSANGLSNSILTSVDGIESLIGTTNTNTATNNTLTTATNTLLTSANTIAGNILTSVDGIEALIGTTNTNTTTNNTLTTATNALITTTNTTIGTSNTLLTAIKAATENKSEVLLIECFDLSFIDDSIVSICYFKYTISALGVLTFNGVVDVSGASYSITGYLATSQGSIRVELWKGLKMRGKSTDFYPYATAVDSSVEKFASFDVNGSLNARAAVLTDEGTFRSSFSNAALELAIGSFTISLNTITGTGFELLDIKVDDFIKVVTDTDIRWIAIAAISPTKITLTANYAGATGLQALHVSRLRQFKGAGTSMSVANGQLLVNGGTTASSIIVMGRPIDVAPLSFRTSLSVSQRIINQTINIGINDDAATTKWFARFQLTGTNNTILECQTGRNATTAPSAAETQITSVTIPTNTGVINEYKIEFMTESVRFYINNILVANHSRFIPLPFDIMSGGLAILNGVVAPASNTIITTDYIACKNHNKLEVGMFSDSESIVSKQPDMTETNYNVVGIIPINTDLMIIDCNNIRELNITCNAMGATGVVTPQWSNSPLFPATIGGNITTSLGVTATNFSSAGIYNSPVYARYCRLRLTTATTAGTTTITAQGVAFASTKSVALMGTSVVSISGIPAVTTSGTTRLLPATTDGFSTFYTIVMAATTNQVLIASGARVVGSMTASNSSALPVFLKLFNKATAPIVGTDVPIATIMIPAATTIQINIPAAGMRFTSGLGYAVTNLMSIVDATALPTAGVVSLFLSYL